MSRVDNIRDEQSKLKRELDTIQAECVHRDQHIKFNHDHKAYMWCCNECKLDVRYPTGDEIDRFIRS